MTALDVMCYLERLKVQLTLTPELELRYRAPRGVMTHVLQGTLKPAKDRSYSPSLGRLRRCPGRFSPRDGLPPVSHVANG